MSFRFRKAISLFPGVKLNLSFSGASLTVGPRGASVNLGSRGTFLNLGLPGTGLYAREKLVEPQRKIQANLSAISGLATEATEAPGDSLRDAVARYNGLVEHLSHLHWTTPAPDVLPVFEADPFSEAEPLVPVFDPATLGERWLSAWREGKEARDKEATKEYEAKKAEWLRAKAEHDARQAEGKALYDIGIRKSVVSALPVFAAESREDQWMFPFSMVASGDEGKDWMYIRIDLPEIEDFPAQCADVSRGKLKWIPLLEKDRRGLYAKYIHGLIFKLIGLGFSSVPKAQSVTAVGYTQRPLLKPGQVYDAYILSVAVTRADWKTIRFDDIRSVDPMDELTRFDLRREMDRQANMHSITPHPKPDSLA